MFSMEISIKSRFLEKWMVKNLIFNGRRKKGHIHELADFWRIAYGSYGKFWSNSIDFPIVLL